jgi:hypothetical protein
MFPPPSALLALVLAAAGGGGGAGGGTNAATDKPFRTEVAPRFDPVFSDTAGLRETIDQFLALQAEMETVRDQFSSAVHDAMAQLGPVGAAPSKTCPPQIPPRYARAAEAGRRFLALGRRYAAHYRDIHRAEDLGDTVGLTPDYRAKAKNARELYLALIRDYREMRAAFYDQLQGEMRHAGCKLTPLAAAGAGKPADGGAAEPVGPDPTNPSDWELEPPEDPPGTAARAPRPGSKTPETTGGGGPAIWIQIDNTRCAQRSALTIDGRAIGDIAAQKKIPVRTHAGPHELCVLPVGEKSACGAAGTVRRVYLYDGWTLAVRCGE